MNQNMDEVMAQVSRVSNRVTLAGVVGVFIGAAMATRKGLPVARTALAMGANWAMVGTSCFVPERLSNLALGQVMNDDDESIHRRLYLSHAIGGAAGGGLVGSLFQFRVLPGVVAFTPLMLVAAHFEIKFEEARSERYAKLLQEIERERNN